MGRDIELFRKDLAVARRLVEHDDEVGVFKDVLHLPAGQLLFFGSVILPFVDRFPTDLELYRIMTTKWTDKKEAGDGR